MSGFGLRLALNLRYYLLARMWRLQGKEGEKTYSYIKLLIPVDIKAVVEQHQIGLGQFTTWGKTITVTFGKLDKNENHDSTDLQLVNFLVYFPLGFSMHNFYTVLIILYVHFCKLLLHIIIKIFSVLIYSLQKHHM